MNKLFALTVLFSASIALTQVSVPSRALQA